MLQNICCLFFVLYCLDNISGVFSDDSFYYSNSSKNSIDYENVFHKDMSKHLGPREQRFISFETKDEEVEINLEFSVPFIKIPVKKAIYNLQNGKPIANINLGTAVFASAVGLGVLFIIPSILNLFHHSMPSTGYRALTENSDWWRIVNNLEETLLANNIDSTLCMQRAICWLIKNSSQNVALGKSASVDKIIDGIASNTWMRHFINGTAIDNAIQDGYKSDKNCSNTYSCQLNQLSLEKIMKKITKNVNRL